MKYLLLCCIEEARWDRLPEAERAGVMRDYGAWVRETERSGHHRASAQLQPSSAATTLRLQAGRLAVTDGPFAETKEQFGGYHLLECRDLDEAIALAKRIPTLRVGGSIEVRPVLETPS
ncbi:MAG TPA: YciI family protein [Nevskiales bacterium]|nr:YciI family protein [Nevskiales bacterium]